MGSSITDFDLLGIESDFDYNMYSTANGATPGANDTSPPGNLDALFKSVTAPVNPHLEGTGHNALDTGADLSSTFTIDGDGDGRP